MSGRTMSRSLVLSIVFVLVGVVAAPAWAGGNVQISGEGVPGAWGAGGCDAADHAGAHYVIAMSGDLDGCIYGYVLSDTVLPNGIIQDWSLEHFVGWYDGMYGSWQMNEHFTSKWDFDTGAQLWGRCQHPIVKGSGTGDFEGITGRLDFKDDVNAGVAHYRGHLKLDN